MKMDSTALRKSFMGGYNKKSVHALLDYLADEKEKELSSLGEENGKLRDRIAELEKENEELSAKLSAREGEKDFVASAIVSAEKEAAKILADAAAECEKMKSDTLASLKTERDNVTNLRMSLYQAMQSYKDKLDTISATDGQ